MNRQALADRIVTYSDGIVAFALVNGFAFLISLGEPDIRCSIARVSLVPMALNALIPVFSTYALFWLRGYEHRLRYEISEDGAEARAEGVEAGVASDQGAPVPIVEDELVARFWRIAFTARLVLIWAFGTLIVLGIYAATQDTSCAVRGG